MTRRGLLRSAAQLGVGSAALMLKAPHALLTEAILNDWIQQANAEAAGLVSPRYYVNIMFPGGPIRFAFDHWQKTKSTDPDPVIPPGAATSFTYDGAKKFTGFEYRTFDHNGTLVPQFFQSLSAAERTAFLDNFLVIRGYTSGVDGHGNNQIAQVYPQTGLPSISGLLADHSNRSFRAVQSPGRGGNFSSDTNVSLNVLSSSQPLKDLLNPVAASNSVRALRKANADTFSQLRSLLNISAPDTKAMQIAKSSLNDAASLLNANFDSYATEWATLQPMYQTAIETGIRSKGIPGINLTLDGSQSLQIISDGGALFKTDNNPNTYQYAAGADLNLCIDQGTIVDFGAKLALADYCIRNDLASSIELSAERLSGLRLTPGGATTFNHNSDCHQSGAAVAVFMKAVMWRGVVEGLLLLQSRLQAAGKWNDTIIHISGDFDRSLSMDGTGAGHGFKQMISSIFSGAFTGGPYVVGNTEAISSGFQNSTQGVAAVIPSYSKLVPSPTTLASTVFNLLACDRNPWQNLAQPLVTIQADRRLMLPYGWGKLV